MPALDDSFMPQHSGEIREALIMIEGDDGAFEFSHMVGWPIARAVAVSCSLWCEAPEPIASICWSTTPNRIGTIPTAGTG